MITQVEAQSYRCLRHVQRSVSPFQILIGPNASGKSAFLDVMAFLSDLVWERQGVRAAVMRRSLDVRDLIWMREDRSFELAIEAAIPSHLRSQNHGRDPHTHVRYEVRVGRHQDGQISLLAESLWLCPDPLPRETAPRTLFPMPSSPQQSIVRSERSRIPPGWRNVVRKIADSGNDYFQSETSGWRNQFGLGRQRSALANLPEDEEKFPVSIWFRRMLLVGIQRLTLNSSELRTPAPPGAPRFFMPDGSTLPWVVNGLEEASQGRLKEWIAHVQTALPDLADIRTVERPEDRSRYLVLRYVNGLEVPSWAVSDGTLRLLALTVLAYIPDLFGTYLIEEPENGIHPRAVETVMQSLSSVYGAQVLVATHSPVILSLARPEDVLCFARTQEGATDIVRGDEHPNLVAWRQETDLGTLFASGVLG